MRRRAASVMMVMCSACVAQEAPTADPSAIPTASPPTAEPPPAAPPVRTSAPTPERPERKPASVQPGLPVRATNPTISPTPTRSPGVLPASPGPTPSDLNRLQLSDGAAAPLRREGTFLIRARGVLTRLPGGESAFVFAKDSAGKAERPMVLLPCQALQRMEQASGRQAAAFALTGQVFVYAGVNYVLPSEAPLLPPSEGAPTNEGTPGGDPPASSDDPSVQDLIQRLAWQRERPRSIDRNDGGDARVRPASGEASELLPEGRMIVRRRGRMVRASDGGWMFSMDGTPEAKADGPLSLLPCANLQRLDAWAGGVGDAATVEITGRVTTHNERNYLLVTMFRLLPTSEVSAR